MTAGALSHQIRGLEELLGLKLFERRVRSIALTPAGKQLFPGLQTGFIHIRDAVAGLRDASDARVLVISTPPGFTSKWLAPRLYRFSGAYPEIDARVSSSHRQCQFHDRRGRRCGPQSSRRCRAGRRSRGREADRAVLRAGVQPQADRDFTGPSRLPSALKGVPLIHDDTLSNRAEMPDLGRLVQGGRRRAASMSAAGCASTAPTTRSTRRSKAPECCSRTTCWPMTSSARGGWSIPFELSLRSGRAYHFVCPKRRQGHPNVQAFRTWIKQEVGALDWGKCANRGVRWAPGD